MTHHPSTQSHCLRRTFAAGLTIAALGFGGCAAERSVTKAQPTAFLGSTGTANAGKISRLPFERAWRDPAVDPAHYSRIVLRPVTTRYLRTGQWKESASTFVTSEEVFKARVGELAQHWNISLHQAFSAPENRFHLTGNAAEPGTLVVEIAITEVVFGRPAANAASYAVAGGGLANAAFFSPSVAFEARVTDGATGKLVATASDRRSTKVKLINVNGFTFTQSNREICGEWSQQIMQAFNKEMFPTVKRTWLGLY